VSGEHVNGTLFVDAESGKRIAADGTPLHGRAAAEPGSNLRQ
jgi:hypothetical protein